ncbi:MAG: glycosyltransferase, partial [Thermoleophilaceae bacterium]|nr:glycosyltransferase [Thermoleophilaceae bacterium]
DPRAEVIGLIDADDLVEPHYLRETIPYFSDPKLGFIQTFEGNRNYEGSGYYTACVDSYQAFYLSNMSSRNERGSIPFVGTMGLFRRSALTSVGGWNEWCICEDTEASLRVAKDGWSGLYIPRCFGRGIVPPSFAGMLVQRHRWCFGAMQILRLHWRSLMPWDRSPGNQLTASQRRDYLMASLSWFRDLVMLAFSLLLLGITAQLVSGSDFVVSPLDGQQSLLPLSFIVVAALCMLATLRSWTTLSYGRSLTSLVISLSVAFVIARGCIEGVARRDGVFLRTSKAAGGRTVFGALRLTKWETALALALYASVGLLATVAHPPWLLMALIFIQASVYLCAPIASIWNLHASGVPGEAYRERFARRRRRAQRRRQAAWTPLARPAGAALAALCVGAAAAAFLAPVSLLHATTVTRAGDVSPTDTDVYLKIGSSYRAISLAQVTDRTLSFHTSDTVLLGEVLRAAAAGGELPHVGLAFRTRGADGRPDGERVRVFDAGTLVSVRERLSGTVAGSVSILLSQRSRTTTRPAGGLPRRGLPAAPAGTAYATLGGGSPAYPVKGVLASQTEAGRPLELRLTTSAAPLLRGILKGGRADVGGLALLVRDGRDAALLSQTFPALRVRSFASRRAGSLSGTATLAVP